MHHAATIYTSAWTNVYYPVRRLDCVFIVLDNNEGVTKLSKLDKSVDKPSVISLMQTDGWLIQNVKYPS